MRLKVPLASGAPGTAAYSLELAARVFAVLFLLVLIVIISGVVVVLAVVVVVGEDGAARATVGLGLEDGGEGWASRAPPPSARVVVAGRPARSTCPLRRTARQKPRRQRGSSSDRAVAAAKRRAGPQRPTPHVFLRRETSTLNRAGPLFLSRGEDRAGGGGPANTRGCRVVAPRAGRRPPTPPTERCRSSS